MVKSKKIQYLCSLIWHVNVICSLIFLERESMDYIKFLKESLTKILKSNHYRQSLISQGLDRQTVSRAVWRGRGGRLPQQWSGGQQCTCCACVVWTQHCQSVLWIWDILPEGPPVQNASALVWEQKLVFHQEALCRGHGPDSSCTCNSEVTPLTHQAWGADVE